MTRTNALRAHTQASLTQTQLPVACYVDAKVYALEQQHLFSQMPKYIGHELMAVSYTHLDVYKRQQ